MGRRGPERPVRPAHSGPNWPLARKRAALPRCSPAPRCSTCGAVAFSGYANEFYAAAVQAGSRAGRRSCSARSTRATHHRRQAAGLAVARWTSSVRVFGVNSWAILVPQALEGVAAVALLYAAVTPGRGPDGRPARRRAARAHAGRGADVPLRQPGRAAVLLLVAAGVRDGPRGRGGARPAGCCCAGASSGFAFLTKMLQAFLVAAGASRSPTWSPRPTPLRRRVLHLLAAGGALVVAAGWWVAAGRAVAGRRRVRTSAARRTTACWSWPSATTASAGSAAGQRRQRRPVAAPASVRHPPGFGRLFSTADGQPDLLAAPRRVRRARRARLALTGRRAAHRPRCAPPDRLGRLAARHRARVQLRKRHHPPVLLGGAGAGDRRARGHRRGRAVARPRDRAARWTLAALLGGTAAWTYVLLGRASCHPRLRWIVLLAGTRGARRSTRAAAGRRRWWSRRSTAVTRSSRPPRTR